MSIRDMMGDRFSVSLLIALGIHASVLLGISFILNVNPLSKAVETLDVVLVNFRSNKAPDDAEFLAQANQEGGGREDQKASPAKAVTPPVPSLDEGQMPVETQPQEAKPVPASQQQVVRPDPAARPPQKVTRIREPEHKIPTAAELKAQSMQLAQLEADLGRDGEFKSRLKRRVFIAANTREYAYAAYMNAWVSKVERVGNLNYPADLRRKKLSGDLLMTVGINQDGSIESIHIQRSSGRVELDQAAERIVRLAAPFSPLPDDIAAKVDVLHITRTWRFSTGRGLETGGGS